MGYKNDDLTFPSNDLERAGSKLFVKYNNHGSTGLVSAASAVLEKYVKDAEFVYRIDQKDVKLEAANELLVSAERAVIDFNKLDNSETKTKNIILAVGAYEASHAAYYFLSLLHEYTIKLGDNTIYRTVDIDNVDKYVALQQEINESSYNMLTDLLKATSKNDYSQKRTKEDHKNDPKYHEDYRDVAIKDHGLQIYHLTMLIDFCQAIKRGMKKWTAAKKDIKDVLVLNEYSKHGDSKCRGLVIFYDEVCKNNPDNITDDQIIEACVRVTNMFSDYFVALIYAEYGPIENVESLDFETKLSKITDGNNKSNSAMSLIEFEDSLKDMNKIAENRDRQYIPKNLKVVCYVERAMEIANVIKNELGRDTFDQMQPPKKKEEEKKDA